MSKHYISFTMTAVTVSPPLLLLLAQHWQMQSGDFKELLLSTWLALQIHAIRIHPIQIHLSDCMMSSFLCVEETGAQVISSAARSVTSGTPAERAKNAFMFPEPIEVFPTQTSTYHHPHLVIYFNRSSHKRL